MKIAIHNSKLTFSERWTNYCVQNGIEYKLVDCYKNDIIRQMSDCDALMWHHFQSNPKAVLFARQLLFALQQSGKVVFPNFNTGWHFDDKLGQKYLLEAIGAPLVPSYIFYSRNEAIQFANNTHYPIVFKLRGGAGSENVRLIHNPSQAKSMINRAFKSGFSRYNAKERLKETNRKLQLGKATYSNLFKVLLHLLSPPNYSKVMGRESGYVYFQDFVPNNDHDIRIIVISGKAFAIKRMVRNNDFRASGSGDILYDRDYFSEGTIKLAFDLTDKLKAQCIAYDFVNDNGTPKLLEISYGFVAEGYDPCPGYWDDSLNWIPGKFDPYGWMVETVISEVNG